jgi:5-methylcytosine-specific restriction enzyme A
MSATRLAEEAGFLNFNAANLQYGLLAREICKQLAVSLEQELGILVNFVRPGAASNEHWLWVMRPNVAQALEDLGWVPRVSHLLFPEQALEAMGKEG